MSDIRWERVAAFVGVIVLLVVLAPMCYRAIGPQPDYVTYAGTFEVANELEFNALHDEFLRYLGPEYREFMLRPEKPGDWPTDVTFAINVPNGTHFPYGRKVGGFRVPEEEES